MYGTFIDVSDSIEGAKTKVSQFNGPAKDNKLNILTESNKRMNEDVSDSIMQNRLSLFKYLNTLDLGHSLSAVEDEPDLPLKAFYQAVYANEYEVEEELKTIQDQDARKILFDIFHYLIKDWWTADGIYFYTNEEMYNLLANRYGWED